MLTDNSAVPLILVVEDDDAHAELIRRAFESSPEEYRLSTANLLSKARELIGECCPNLVLTDYRLPDGDGHDLVAMVNDTCPVVMMTSQGSEQVAVEAMKAGVLDYVIKSVETFASLPLIVRQTLREWDLIQERKRIRDELIKAERLESLGVLAGGIAHDFNNMLMAIVGHISLARESIPIDSLAYRSLEVAAGACETAMGLSCRLITFARGGEPVKKAVSVDKLLRDCLLLQGNKQNVDLRIRDDLHTVEADEGQIHQVFSNIIVNAQQAMPGGGRLSVLAENAVLNGDGSGLAPGAYVRISFTDEGCGIDEEVLPNIFDPYFTTKPEGNGLGLASSYSIVARHGGRIFVSSRVGVGSVFTVYLPAQENACAENAREDRSLRDVRKGQVLVMDDDEMLRQLAELMLGKLGYRATVCADGAEAVSLYRAAMAAGSPFTAVILDLVITRGMGGRETAQQILSCDPNARLIVASGYCGDPVLARSGEYGFTAALAKPYTFEQLEETLRQCASISNITVSYAHLARSGCLGPAAANGGTEYFTTQN